jgi:hypothetical protein
MVVDPLGTLLVLANANAAIGSLEGSGTLQMGKSGQGNQTLLTIETPRGESDVFTGTVDGAGGTIQMNGSGTLAIGNVDYDPQTQSVGTGAFDLRVADGTMLVDGRVDAQTLTVLPGATFGGPGMMNFSQPAELQGGATFAATINGTAPGQYTQLIANAHQGQAAVDLGGDTLSLSFGPSYDPRPGDTFPLLSATGGIISGQFTKVLDAQSGQVIPLNGQPFLTSSGLFQLNETSSSITLSALAAATTTGLTSSANPSHPGQPVSFTATVGTRMAPVTTGTVSFEQGTTVLATVPLSNSGTAMFTTAALPLGNTAITAVYNGSAGILNSTSPGFTQAVSPYSTTVTLTLGSQALKHGKKIYELVANVVVPASGGAAPKPSGTVVFRRNGAMLGSLALQDGVASLAIGRTRPKHKHFTADFLGTSTFSGSSGQENS